MAMDTRENFEEEARKRREKTDKIAAKIGALPDEELFDVAGGRDDGNRGRKTIVHYEECSANIGTWVETLE